MIKVWILSFLMVGSLFAKEFTAEENSVKSFMEDLFRASKLVNSPTEKKMAREKIAASMDWDRIALDCLGKDVWAKQTKADQEKFRNTLKEVVEKSAYSRLDKFWVDGTTYTFSEIKTTGAEPFTTTKFKVKEDDFEIKYYFEKKGKTWKIYDISFEDIRYSKNINKQLKEFLKEKKNNFKSVLEKLSERSKELSTEAS